MKWFGWRMIATASIVLLGGVAYAVGSGERMPSHPEVEAWLADLPAAAERLEPHSPAREAIEAGELDAAREMLRFRPLSESPTPEGFPPFTPVGVIEVKTYPTYRKAVGPSFWPLFRHIQKQDIPMTAPVEMSRPAGRNGDGGMAFLYQNTQVGQPGPIDGVGVEDTPETVVASLGVRGRMNEATAEAARERLEAWLASQSEYKRVDAGDASFRLFGYNSPMVPNRNKYWEAQMLLAQRNAD